MEKRKTCNCRHFGDPPAIIKSVHNDDNDDNDGHRVGIRSSISQIDDDVVVVVANVVGWLAGSTQVGALRSVVVLLYVVTLTAYTHVYVDNVYAGIRCTD